MEAEIADLRRELRSLREEMTRPRANSAPPPPPPPEVETNMAANLERMTLLMESRFAAIEEQMRSVRPAPSPARTLSPAPRARPTPPPISPIPGPSVEEYPPLPQRGRKERAVAKSTPPPPACPAPTTSSAAAEDGWTTVGKKKAARKAAQPSSGTQPAATAADAQTTRARRQRGRGRVVSHLSTPNPGIPSLPSKLVPPKTPLPSDVRRAPLHRSFWRSGGHRLSVDASCSADAVARRGCAVLPCAPHRRGQWRRAQRSWRTCAASWRASGRSSPRLAPGQSVPRHHPRQSPHHRRRRPQTWTRGRGRPPTTGEYVGLAEAKQKYVEAQRAALALETEKEIVERASAMATTRVTRSRAAPTLASQPSPEASAEHAQGLKQQITDSLAVVSGVAKVSKGLKGTLQKALKEAAAAIQEASEELLSRTSSEEVALLRAANGRMESEIADLRNELQKLQTELVRPRVAAPPPVEPPPNVESVMAANLERMTLLFESRFAAMEERMRSAQLASSPRPAPTPSPAPPSRRSLPSSPSMLRPSAEEFPPLPSQRVSTETVVTESIPPPPTCPAPLPSSAAADEGWTTVSKRKRKAAQPPSGTQPAAAAANAPTIRARRQRGRGRGGKRKGDEAQAPASQPPPPPPPPPKKETRAKGRKVPRLRPPKSSAVVLTMQSGAEERGVTYASLLSQAKANIRLADLGIEGGLRLKRARTGARMLVVPGATSAPQADALAVSLRTVLKAEDVRVSRPEKAVYVRVSGLDDTTEGEDVAAAIARTTGCSLESIKATKVRPGPDGAGTTVVACPVAAAKSLLKKETKLLVGWASATVEALPHRAQRCFRCHELGHVAAGCTSEVNRSDFCYRCGVGGHLVPGPCTAKPHCAVCEAAGRPAGHQLGGGSCGSRKPTRSKKASRIAPDRAAAAAATTSAAAGGGKE
ncbi:hypothetical protein K1T71_008073 [Dendrolimus kikuchii]|uniref:Uncharacterized protein n=1 Tax=Dendrolimus kikuchii TaxID=765133 RepID=A0ACC1CWM8_9NEOP|nr:hypothetical protein K1T71_008073 [Dendrolimus kikuchii]